MSFSRDHPNVVVAALFPGGAAYSNDNGLTWRPLPGATSDPPGTPAAQQNLRGLPVSVWYDDNPVTGTASIYVALHGKGMIPWTESSTHCRRDDRMARPASFAPGAGRTNQTSRVQSNGEQRHGQHSPIGLACLAATVTVTAWDTLPPPPVACSVYVVFAVPRGETCSDPVSGSCGKCCAPPSIHSSQPGAVQRASSQILFPSRLLHLLGLV